MKKYVSLKMAVVAFQWDDIVTASGETDVAGVTEPFDNAITLDDFA